MTLLTSRFRDHLTRAGCFPTPGVAIVAVSGGVDSLALLDLLHAEAPSHGLTLVVAHADHQIDPSSETVTQRVASVAARYGCAFELGELGLGAGASETVARRARYRWLRAVQERRQARYLVTAHQRDDQVETVLLRVLCGSGPAGLAGIPARARGGLVRPLLPFGRDQLAAHVAARGLEPYDDPANRDPRHLRSWIRHTLVPLLGARLGPAGAAHLLRVGRHATADRRAWDQVLPLLPGLDLRVDSAGFNVARHGLRSYDDALAAAVLAAAARRVGLVLGPRPARRLAALAAQPSGRRLDLPSGCRADVAFDRLRVYRVHEDVPSLAPSPIGSPGLRGECVFGAFVVRWDQASVPAALSRGGWTTWVESGWTLRGYRTGDRLEPLGGVGHRPVRQLLMEARVPRTERDVYPVVTRGDAVLWVPGVCRSAVDLPGPGTLAVRLDVIRQGDGEPDGWPDPAGRVG